MDERDNTLITEMTAQLMNVRLDLRELSVKVDSFKDLSHSVSEMDKRLTAVEESSKSAHLRMNTVEKILITLALAVAGGIITAAITFVVKGGLAT